MEAHRAIRAAVAALALGLACLTQAAAQPAPDFYKGKTLRLIVGSSAGGGFSMYAMLLSSHYGKFIPGNPSVVVEHMPGAGGINSINYLANAAPQDGSVIAVAMPNFFVTPFVEPKEAMFDPARFAFVGRVSDFGRVLAAWHTSGIKTLDDLKRSDGILAAGGRRSTTSVQPMMINDMLGARMKIIQGYLGSGPTAIALERGEVQLTTIAWSTLQSLHKEWMTSGKINVIAGLDFSSVPLPGVPRIRDLIKDPEHLALWDFVALPSEFGTAFLASPKVPQERLQILRKAFDEAVASPDFLADAAKRGLDVNPQTGAELDALFAKSGRPTPEMVDRLSYIMGVKQ
ncbi:MAG TPA: tripartite tricarboxylate transporter substrate-binding protein [Beijerinckiaceae bacterium]|jgi:tripartite-type tricarboxylate transporter receptor subunit TctC